MHFFMQTKNLGMIEDFEASRNGEGITHLQFADDTILCSSTKRDEVFSLKRILRCFHSFGAKSQHDRVYSWELVVKRRLFKL